jgi:MoaA/NifB/PqqE/SkfB family radical SAM enzyme
MSLEIFESIVDDLHDLGTRRLDGVGRGEPLMNRDALEMIRYAKTRGMEVLLISNGSLLDADLIRPWSRIQCGDDIRRYTLADVVRKWSGEYS